MYLHGLAVNCLAVKWTGCQMSHGQMAAGKCRGPRFYCPRCILNYVNVYIMPLSHVTLCNCHTGWLVVRIFRRRNALSSLQASRKTTDTSRTMPAGPTVSCVKQFFTVVLTQRRNWVLLLFVGCAWLHGVRAQRCTWVGSIHGSP